MSKRDDIQAQNVPLNFDRDDPEVFIKVQEFARAMWFQINELRDRLRDLEDKVLE